MADEKKSYPAISKGNWIGLRQQFKRTMPPIVTNTYVATILDMSEESARANVIGHLKTLGIIDDSGKPTERAFRWRDNGQYREVCEEIRQEIYPDELKSIASDATADVKQVENWFQRHAKVGEDASKKYARVYMLLLEADPEATTSVVRESNESPKQSKRNSAPSRKQAAPAPASKEETTPTETTPKPTSERRSEMPSLHINVQIHISPEASPEQIDQIFESMAKHLRGVS